VASSNLITKLEGKKLLFFSFSSAIGTKTRTTTRRNWYYYHHHRRQRHYQPSFEDIIRTTMSSATDTSKATGTATATAEVTGDNNKSNSNGNDSLKRPFSADEDNNDATSQKQQKQDDDHKDNKSNRWKKMKNNRNKSSNGGGRKDNTWKKDYGDDKRDKRDDPPHAGSFANPAMRKQFDVVLENEESNDKEGEQSNNVDKDNDTQKRKVALLLGFLGTKYGGFQINPEQRTLHAEIELALYRSGMVSKSNFGTPHKYSWSNSARTDKGVHACAQVCSLKLELPEKDWEFNSTTKERLDGPRLRLQKNLPDDILVLDMVRTTRNFCAKTQRDRVRYQYMIPSFLLHPDWKSVMESQGIDTNSGREERENSKLPLSIDEAKKVQHILKEYRSTEDNQSKLKAGLRKYEGTHSFHNFTKGLKPGEAKAKRYIESFQVQDPVIVDGMEWIPTQVLGQSFLLHQIRKMVCVAIDVARGAVPIDFVDIALSTKGSIALHVAPAQGLFLEMSYYDGYNRRKSSQKNHDLSNLNWTVDGPAKDRWIKSRDVVRSHIVEEENNQSNFIQYLFLHECIYDCRKVYGSVEGLMQKIEK